MVIPAWALVIVGISLALIFAIIGSRVQKGSKFVYPKDPFTISLLSVLSTDTVLWILHILGVIPFTLIPVEPYALHIPVIAGYLLGYWINGSQEVKQIKEVDEEGNERSYYEVFYENKEKRLCIAEQTNRGMFKRVFLKVHHYVEIPGNLNFRGRESRQNLKRPWWPGFKYEEIEILDRKDYSPTIIKAKRWNVKQYSTRLILADKYHVSPAVFKRKMSVLKQANITITELAVEVTNLQTQLERRSYETASVFVSDMNHYRPIPQYFEEKERKEREKELQMHKEEEELAEQPDEKPTKKWRKNK